MTPRVTGFEPVAAAVEVLAVSAVLVGGAL